MYQKFSKKHWDIFSLYIIPISTILFAGLDGWTSSNFSSIAYAKNKQIAFLLWGFLTAWYYNAYSRYLFRIVNFNGKLAITFLWAATISLIFAITTPYMPDALPQQAKLHFIFAFCSPLLLLCSIICFQIYLERINKARFKRARLELTIIVVVSVITLTLVGFVSSLLEIFVCISVCYYLRVTHKRIESEKIQTVS